MTRRALFARFAGALASAPFVGLALAKLAAPPAAGSGIALRVIRSYDPVACAFTWKVDEIVPVTLATLADVRFHEEYQGRSRKIGDTILLRRPSRFVATTRDEG